MTNAIKLSVITYLVNLPYTTQVCTDWRPHFLLDAIEKVLDERPVLLGDGTILIDQHGTIRP